MPEDEVAIAVCNSYLQEPSHTGTLFSLRGWIPSTPIAPSISQTRTIQTSSCSLPLHRPARWSISRPQPFRRANSSRGMNTNERVRKDECTAKRRFCKYVGAAIPGSPPDSSKCGAGGNRSERRQDSSALSDALGIHCQDSPCRLWREEGRPQQGYSGPAGDQCLCSLCLPGDQLCSGGALQMC